MTVINIRIKAEELEKEIENISEETEASLKTAIEQIAYAAYSEGVRLAQEQLDTTRADYLKDLKFEKLEDNVFLIYLDGDDSKFGSNRIEEGFSPFDEKTGLLNGPKAKTGADGKKYNTVPYKHQPHAKGGSPAMKDMRAAVNQLIKERGIGKIIREGGKVKQGIAATIKDTGIPNLEGLVKIQKQYQKKVESYYLTFRRVSENSDPASWMHPGYKGAHIFEEIQKYVEREIDNILNVLLG